MKKIFFILVLAGMGQAMACTVFVLTDGNRTFFFNNEDYTNPDNKMWFVSGGKGHFGCVFVGYDDGSAQGGMNTQGLAFDWYAGTPVDYQPDAKLIPIEDNSSERMLEQCKNIEDAIQFYQTYAEPGFANASILIADKTGASVIIGAKNGELFFERSMESSVLGGRGKKIFESLFHRNTPINLAEGASILEQCVATGRGGTLYSNSYDLNTGDIHIHDFSKGEFVTLNIHEELRKGEHFYDIGRIAIELHKPIKPLQINMKRLILFEYQPLENQEPRVSTLVKNIFVNGAMGNLKAEYFTDALWSELRPLRDDLSSELAGLGKLKSHHLIQKENRDQFVLYNFIMVFENARLLQEFRLDKNGKVANLQTLSSFVTNSTRTGGAAGKESIDPVGPRFYILLIPGSILLIFIFFLIAKRKKSIQ